MRIIILHLLRGSGEYILKYIYF